MYNTDRFSPACFRSSGSLVLNGETVTYDTVCEDNVFYNESGEPIATIFSFSYFRTNTDDHQRPVAFCFNGGPGASSMTVHAGFFGAKRVKYPDDPDAVSAHPPYEVIDNPDCLLDVADVVLVDPIGTGFGLLLDEASGKLFYGIDEDAEALLMFIGRWLSRYHRWGSPKYMIGESYGCTRAATATGIGCTGGPTRTHGIIFDGLVMLGNTVTTAKYFNRGIPAEPAVQALPTMAAIHWYHKHPTDQSMEEFVSEAAEFAGTEYLVALYKGEALIGEARNKIKQKLMYYTGVSSEYLDSRDLRLERTSFCKDVLKAQNKVVSILDGRFTRPGFLPTAKEGTPGYAADATSIRFSPYYHAALCGEMFDSLGIRDFDRSYVPSASFGTELVPNSIWNFENAQLVSGDRLTIAMNLCPGLRTFFANGWFDLCTQTSLIWHTTMHTHLPMDRVFFKGYYAGHMPYIGEDNAKMLADDLRKFILGKDPTQ